MHENERQIASDAGEHAAAPQAAAGFTGVDQTIGLRPAKPGGASGPSDWLLRTTGVRTTEATAASRQTMLEVRSDAEAQAISILAQAGGEFQGSEAFVVKALTILGALRLAAAQSGVDVATLLDPEAGYLVQVLSLARQAEGRGLMLLSALADLLASGGAHVRGLIHASVPPLPATDLASALENRKLGWTGYRDSSTALRPGGPCIGTVLEKNGQMIILFHAETALEAVLTSHPGLSSFRTAERSFWGDVWHDGLTPSFIPRQTNSRGAVISTVRLTLGSGTGRLRPTGVPIAVATILSRGAERP
jgi:hypothetical protein